MPRRHTTSAGRGAALGAFTAIAVIAVGCGSSPITSSRIERAIGPTFANLVHVQLDRVGLPVVTPSAITVTARCRKLVPGTGVRGAGDWTCTLVWYGPNRRPLTDTYDLVVGTDGCYTASINGAESQLGGPTAVTSGGNIVRNVLYVFDGCFDTT